MLRQERKRSGKPKGKKEREREIVEHFGTQQRERERFVTLLANRLWSYFHLTSLIDENRGASAESLEDPV